MEKERALDFYEKMFLIRKYEETLLALAQNNEIFTFCSSLGQEASAVGVVSALSEDDIILTNHRSAGHLLARGAEPRRCLAEVMGKATGYCKGKSGPLHISVKELGIYLTSTIVGGELSLVTGVGLSLKMLKTNAIAVCFFGDGAACEGIFHESLNLASVWELPILYVCENNQWQAFVHRKETMRIDHISEWAKRYKIPAITVDGNDVEEVYKNTKKAVDSIRSQNGPYFIETYTYRLRGHMEPMDQQEYVDKEELENWRKKDPVICFKQKVLELASAKEIEELENNIELELQRAVHFAKESPYPNLDELTTDVFVV